MIPDNSKKRLEQLRQEAAFRAQLQQQYDKEMSKVPLAQMVPFSQWMDQRNKPMAKGGKVLPREQREANKAKFLAKSKVKDRMYHATNSDFDKFRQNHRGAHFVTPDRDFANEHIGDEGWTGATMNFQEGANIMPVHVQVQNPFDYAKLQDVKNLFRQAKKDNVNLDRDWKEGILEGNWDALENEKLMRSIKKLGHDAMYVTERDSTGEPIKNLGIFDANKIKSAIGNRGTYDVSNPDITKAKGGAVHPMGINVASDTKAGLSYADMIVDGHKKYESRNSDTLRPYVGKRVAIVRTGEGKAKAIGEVTIGEPKVVNEKQFRAMENEHKVPKGSRFDINTPTKHLYPMHDPVRYEEERDVGHGIVSRKVIHKAEGGKVEPTQDEMRLALAKGGSVKEPKSTVKAYKLFRVHKDHPGKLFPLFVDANTPVEMNKWVDAKEGEMSNGKVKSKIGALAYRPGWHAGDLPIATHIGEKSDPSLTAPDRRPANHAWAEVEMPNDVDWQTEANKRGTNAQGKLVPVKAHITDQIPKGGHYRYKTNPNMTGNWLIGGSMKVNKVLSDAEVERINKKAGMADLPRTEPFAKKTFGFAHGGSVHECDAPEEWKAEEYVNHKAEGGKVELTPDQMREALAKKMRHGMYSPLERLAVDIPRNKGTGAEFMAEISKRQGFKPEEVADRKIPIPEGKMTKLEFLQHLRKHSLPPLQEFEMPNMGTGTEARNDRANDYYGDDYENLSHEHQMNVADWVRKHNAKYSQYQIPGGENYREMLLKLPALSIEDERRINSLQIDKKRTDPTEWANSENAKKLDALMEKAKKFDEPYKSGHWRMHPNVLAHVRLSDREGPDGEKLLHVEELQSDWHQQGRKHGYVRPREEVAQEMRKEHERLLQEHETKLKEKRNALFNEFKSIKNQLRSMPIGASDVATQLRARELDIAKEFKALDELQPPEMPRIRNDGVPNAPFKKSWHELGMKHVLHHAAKHGYHGVVITPGDAQAERWGDDGLRVHYDKKIPEFLNKFGRPFGVEMKPHAHRIAGEPDDYGNASERLGLARIPMDQLTPEQNQAIADEADKKLHYFPINDKMRTSILKEGMPQYLRGGIVHKAEGGAVLPIEQIKAQMMNKTPYKGLSDLQSIGANEAPSLGVKAYVPTAGRPDNGQMPVGGVNTSQGDLPVGGIDMNRMQQGQQLMPNQPQAGMQQGMDQVPQGDKIPTMDGTGMPPNPNANPNQMGSNILSMTPQGQAMAAMKPQGLAKGGEVKMARGGMPFAIKPQQELPKAPSEFTPYDDTKPSIPSLAKAFDEAIAHHLSLPNEDRLINSQRAAMQVAHHIGMTSSGKPKDLLGQNEKLLKSGKGIEGQEPVKLPDGRGVETTGLALAPAYEEGNFNTCPNHHSCKAECLGKTSGNYFKLGGGQDLSEFKGPRLNSLLKTNAFLRDPHAMAVKLYDEIDSAKQMAAANGNHLGVRLNVLSDINPRVHKAIIEAHPDVTFYDYTKNNTNPIAPNHHYTYSSTGVSQPGVDNPHTNWKQMRRRLDQGDNVAMAFTHKDHLPTEVHDQETGKKYKVIDGDTHDFRPLDLVGEGEDGVIVGLKNKKATGKMDEAHIDSKGFFLHYDPQLKMSTNAKGRPVYARTPSTRISEKTGKPMLGETIPQNRTVNIQPQTRGMIPLTNDGEKQ